MCVCQALSEFDEFKNLDRDMEGSAKRWKKFVESEAPEKEKFPQEWKNKTGLQKLCMMRCMRPDRMSYAVRYKTHTHQCKGNRCLFW
jgi:dynein heavy chain